MALTRTTNLPHIPHQVFESAPRMLRDEDSKFVYDMQGNEVTNPKGNLKVIGGLIMNQLLPDHPGIAVPPKSAEEVGILATLHLKV